MGTTRRRASAGKARVSAPHGESGGRASVESHAGRQLEEEEEEEEEEEGAGGDPRGECEGYVGGGAPSDAGGEEDPPRSDGQIKWREGGERHLTKEGSEGVCAPACTCRATARRGGDAAVGLLAVRMARGCCWSQHLRAWRAARVYAVRCVQVRKSVQRHEKKKKRRLRYAATTTRLRRA